MRTTGQFDRVLGSVHASPTRLPVQLISAILPAARGHHHQALPELVAAGQVPALMLGEHALPPW